MMSGEIITWTTGREPLPPFVITNGNPEAARLRAALVKVRPVGHDPMCDSEHGGPDLWIDESENGPSEGWRTVEWKPGVGLVCTDESVSIPAYVGWCCDKARQRQEIDAALNGA